MNRFLDRALRGREILTIPEPTPLIQGWVDRGDVFALSGDFASGKGFISLSMAMSVATGRDWFGAPVPEAGRVLYINDQPNMLERRVRGWLAVRGDEGPSGFQTYEQQLDLTSREAQQRIAEVCESAPPLLVVVDSVTRVIGSTDTAAGRLFDWAQQLTEATGATVCLNTHTGGARRPAGRRFADLEWRCNHVLSIEGRMSSNPVRLSRSRVLDDDGLQFTVRDTPAQLPYLVVEEVSP